MKHICVVGSSLDCWIKRAANIVRSPKLASVSQGVHLDTPWWQQPPGGLWCPRCGHFCTRVLTGKYNQNTNPVLSVKLHWLAFCRPSVCCCQLLPACFMGWFWLQLDYRGSSSSLIFLIRSLLGASQVWNLESLHELEHRWMFMKETITLKTQFVHFFVLNECFSSTNSVTWSIFYSSCGRIVSRVCSGDCSEPQTTRRAPPAILLQPQRRPVALCCDAPCGAAAVWDWPLMVNML